MSIFQNPILSLKGQKERLSNVASTLKAAITLQPIKANVQSKTSKAALEFVANNPYSVAAVGAGITTGTLAKAVSSASTKVKVLTGAAAIVAAPPLISSASARKTAINVVSGITPESLFRLSSDVTKASQRPSKQSVLAIAKENPVLATTISAAAVYLGGKAALNLYSGVINTAAVQSNTQALQQGNKISDDVIKGSTKEAKIQANAAVDVAKLQLKQSELQFKAQEKVARIEAESLEKQAKEQRELIELASKNQIVSTPVIPVTPKKRKKKKSTKKKSKKKKSTKQKRKKSTKKKKRKSIKRKKKRR